MKKLSFCIAVFVLFIAIHANAQTVKPTVIKPVKTKPMSITDEDDWRAGTVRSKHKASSTASRSSSSSQVIKPKTPKPPVKTTKAKQ